MIPTKKTTVRGFGLYEFVDRYDARWSIQKSSSAMEDCIWLGIDDPDPKIMASDAIKLGLPTRTDTGWVPYKIPDEVLVNTRMHLTRD